MKSILKITILFVLLTLVLLTMVSCKNILGDLSLFGDNGDTEGATPESTTPPHSHAFGAWTITQNATCTEKGTQERTCSCGKKETQEINALGHTEVVDSAVTPTCTTDGLSVGMHCSVCGEILLAQEVTPATHVWAQIELVRAATCFVPGEEKCVCRTCGVEGTVQTEVLEHNFVQNEQTKLYSCTICDARIFAGHLYAAFEGEYHWFEAYQACANMGGHLVTITSAREQEILSDIMNSELRSSAFYWMGGIRVSGAFKWVTEEPFEYRNWEKGQPNFYDQNQYFINTYSHHQGELAGWWNDMESSFRWGFVCEWDLDITKCEHTFTEWEITCEPTCWNDGAQYRICTYCGVEQNEVLSKLEHDFAFVEETGMTTCEHCGGAKYNGHIYVLVTDSCGWFEAYSRCEAFGGHLATITSEKEQTFIASYMKTFDSSALPYVGAYSDGKQWHWITNEPFEYTNWKSGEPSNSSGYEWVMHIGYRDNVLYTWNDVHPEDHYQFLCEFECEE